MLVSVLVLNRLDDYFTSQQTADLEERAAIVSSFVQAVASTAAGDRLIVNADGRLNPDVIAALESDGIRGFIADRTAEPMSSCGSASPWAARVRRPSSSPRRTGRSCCRGMNPRGRARPGNGCRSLASRAVGPVDRRYSVEVTLANPYTFRAAALANVTGLLVAIALFALGLAVVVSAALARRFTTPLRRLTEASRGLAEGDLTRRVPAAEVRAGSSELAELAVQFNTMADRLEESVEIIRRDRDRSRDFLADVSHELRTPLAALRTFNELLIEGAADDPEARAEFLESSAEQIERLDWLAQNLLELSKLDSGLVLLDLRPDDLRAAVESAVDQTTRCRTARGHGGAGPPDAPIRIRHDPPRIGQVVANLVGNAVKFTPRGGSVRVSVEPTPDGARIDVVDTGVGIDPSELPHIFERFYRGSRANEARGAGAASASPSSARSSTCTAGRSRSRAGQAAGAGSRSVCRRTRGTWRAPRPPSRQLSRRRRKGRAGSPLRRPPTSGERPQTHLTISSPL